jgi:hypothetical protein
MIPAALVEFLESGLAVSVGTCGIDLMPETTQAVCVAVSADHASLRLFLPVATARATIEDLRANPNIAVTLSSPPTHRTVQLKGRVSRIAPAGHEEEALVKRYIANVVEQLVSVGLPAMLTQRISHWPCWAVEISVSEIFVQTPGPRAGSKLESGFDERQA